MTKVIDFLTETVKLSLELTLFSGLNYASLRLKFFEIVASYQRLSVNI